MSVHNHSIHYNLVALEPFNCLKLEIGIDFCARWCRSERIESFRKKTIFYGKITHELENYIFFVLNKLFFEHQRTPFFLTIKKIEPFTNYQNENIRTGPSLYLNEL